MQEDIKRGNKRETKLFLIQPYLIVLSFLFQSPLFMPSSQRWVGKHRQLCKFVSSQTLFLFSSTRFTFDSSGKHANSVPSAVIKTSSVSVR